VGQLVYASVRRQGRQPLDERVQTCSVAPTLEGVQEASSTLLHEKSDSRSLEMAGPRGSSTGAQGEWMC